MSNKRRWQKRPPLTRRLSHFTSLQSDWITSHIHPHLHIICEIIRSRWTSQRWRFFHRHRRYRFVGYAEAPSFNTSLIIVALRSVQKSSLVAWRFAAFSILLAPEERQWGGDAPRCCEDLVWRDAALVSRVLLQVAGPRFFCKLPEVKCAESVL